MAIIVTNESSLQGDPTEEAIRQALAGMDLASVQDSTTASRYAVSSVDGANVPTLVGAQVGGNTGTQAGTTTQNIIGRDSVQAVTTANLVTINLLNDALAPGNTFLYSTGTTGANGWNALSGMLHQTANILLTTGTDGTVTFTLGGAAAGDLSGTYPNPTVAKINGTALGTTSTTAGEVLLGNGTAIASTPISGDATLSGTGALTLAASGVTAGSYGDATHTATFTVDAKGRLTLAGTAAIAFPVTSVFGRTGAVVPAANDYTFAQIGSKPTTLAGYGITDALNKSNNLSDLASNATAVVNLHAGFSYVFVALTTNQTATPSAPNTILFNTVTYDTQSEYTAATGTFKAKNSGTYFVSAGAHIEGLTDGEDVQYHALINGVVALYVSEVTVGSVGGAGLFGSFIIRMNANDALTMSIQPSGAASFIDGIPATTYLTIYRIL